MTRGSESPREQPVATPDGGGNTSNTPTTASREQGTEPQRRTASDGAQPQGEAFLRQKGYGRWHVSVVEASEDRVRLHIIHGSAADDPALGGEPLTWPEVLHLWAYDRAFQDFFSETLADSPYEAFFWETPPLCPAWLVEHQPFEMVLLNAQGELEDSGDDTRFAEHLEGHTPGLHEPIRVFQNLSGDALLLAPAFFGSRRHYPHLAAFLRGAPVEQRRELWRELGEAGQWRLEGGGRSPVWIGTDGRTLPWLHVRIDSSPKYTKHGPYRAVPEASGISPLGLSDDGYRTSTDDELPEQLLAAEKVHLATFLAEEAAANAKLLTRCFEDFRDDHPLYGDSLELRREAARTVEKASLLVQHAMLLREASIDARDAVYM